MAPGLRNEDYVAFLDESGETGLEIVSGVLIPARWLRPAERRWRAFVHDRLGSGSGRTEVKGRDLLRGKGASLHAQEEALAAENGPLSARAAGRQFYRDALEHVAGITVSHHALARLRALSPRDACGSGRRDACLVPGLG
jgi:hypothetical protein